MRSKSLPVLCALLAVGAVSVAATAAPAAGAAAKKPAKAKKQTEKKKPTAKGQKRCPAGKARLVVRKKSSCVAPSKALPSPAKRRYDSRLLAEHGIDRVLKPVLKPRSLPPRLRSQRQRLHSRLRTVRGRLPGLQADLDRKLAETSPPATPPAALRAFTISGATITVGPGSGSGGSSGGSSGGATIEFRDTATGGKGALEIGMEFEGVDWGRDSGRDNHGDGNVDLTFGVSWDEKGNSGSTKTTMRGTSTDEIVEHCPTAAGVIRNRRIIRSSTTSALNTPPTPTTITSRDTGTISLTGQVDRTATLTSVAVSASVKGTETITVKRGRRTYRQNLNLTATVTGTINGRTGARSGLQTTVTATGSGANLISQQSARDSYLRQISTTIEFAFQRLKRYEQEWQKPNTCAKLMFTPADGGEMAKGERKAVTGAVRAIRGGHAEGDWTLKAKAKGDVEGLPSKDAPVKLTMIAEEASKEEDSVNVTARATSPAGVAEHAWIAKGGKAKLRVVEGPAVTLSESVGEKRYGLVDDDLVALPQGLHLTLDTPLDQPLTVRFAQEGETATGGRDFEPQFDGTVTFPAGSTTPDRFIPQKILDDLKPEHDEHFKTYIYVGEEDVNRVEIVHPAVTTTIADDDDYPAVVSGTFGGSFTSTGSNGNELDVSFTGTLTAQFDSDFEDWSGFGYHDQGQARWNVTAVTLDWNYRQAIYHDPFPDPPHIDTCQGTGTWDLSDLKNHDRLFLGVDWDGNGPTTRDGKPRYTLPLIDPETREELEAGDLDNPCVVNQVLGITGGGWLYNYRAHTGPDATGRGIESLTDLWSFVGEATYQPIGFTSRRHHEWSLIGSGSAPKEGPESG